MGNAALRQFCVNIDLTDSSESTKRLFSCKFCEVHVTDTDCKQHGLKLDKCTGLKPFNALVMDGKFICARREFPVQKEDSQKLTGTKGLKCKLMNNRVTRSSLTYFTQALRRLKRSVEYGRADAVKYKLCSKGGTVWFRLGALLDVKGVKKQNYRNYMTLARWFCDSTSCLCVGNKWCVQLSHTICQKARTVMGKKKGCGIACRLVGMLFGIGEDATQGDAVTTGVQVRTRTELNSGKEAFNSVAGLDGNGGTEAGAAEETDDSDAESDGSETLGGSELNGTGSSDIRMQWIYFKVADSFRCPSIMDLLLENIQFALGEPITLGFLPYFTHNSSTETGVEDEDTVEGPSTSKDDGIDSFVMPDGVWDDWSERYLNAIRGSQMETDEARRKKAIDLLTEESEEVHSTVSKIVLGFAECSHDGIVRYDYPCERCCTTLDAAYYSMQEQNTVVATLIYEISRV